MAEDLAACNAAYEEFKKEIPDGVNYFIFLSGFKAGMEHEAKDKS